MTVETTSFLSGAKITTNGSEKSAKLLKNHKNLIIFLFATILLLFCVSASILQIWIMNRMNGIQEDLDTSLLEKDQQIQDLVQEMQKLKAHVNKMEKEMDYNNDLFDEVNEFDKKTKTSMKNVLGGIESKLKEKDEKIRKLEEDVNELKENLSDIEKELEASFIDEYDEFEKKYDQDGSKDEIDLDDEHSYDDEKNKFDVLDEEEDDEEFDSSQSGSGYGENYDEENDDYENGSQESLPTPEQKSDDDNNIYKDMIKIRRSRSITDVTNQGIPIIEEPYPLRRNQSRSGSGAMNVILPNGRDANNPKLKLTWDNSKQHWSTSRREQSHRNVNRNHNTRHHHNLQDSRNRFAFAAAPVHHSFESYGKKFDEVSSSPSSIQTRRSRVMHVEDKTKAFKQVVRKDQLDRLQEVRKAPEQWTNQQNVNGRRRAMNPMRRNLELKNGKRMKITAVHYEGDASSLAVGHHQNQGEEEGNNKVKLNKNEYIHWTPAGWLNSHGMDKFFSMDNNGVLTVKDHGVFLIYAQVVYSNDHDGNGFRIELNDHIKYQCLTMSHATTRQLRTNSCYTSGLIHLKHGDRIQLRDIGNQRSVMLEPSKSFFGLIKINLMPASESSEVESFNSEK